MAQVKSVCRLSYRRARSSYGKADLCFARRPPRGPMARVRNGAGTLERRIPLYQSRYRRAVVLKRPSALEKDVE
jgi:hypothetical protein